MSSLNQKKKTVGGSLPPQTVSTPTSPLQRLKDVGAAVQADDHATVVRLLGGEKTISSYPSSIQKALQNLYVKSLLQNGQAKEALVELSKWSNQDDDCLALRAYALYKQKEYKQVSSLIAKQTASTTTEENEATLLTTLQYLRAQSLYHLSDLDGCFALYQQLLLQNDKTDLETKVQIYTNMVTARLANATPYCPTSSTENVDDDLVSQVLTLLELFNDDSPDYPYDLAYSLASWQLLISSSSTQHRQWGQLLQKAVAACRRANKDHDDDPSLLLSELAPLLTNQALLTGTTGTASLLDCAKDDDDETTKALPAAVQWVRQVNRCLATPGLAALKQLLLLQEPSSPTTASTALQKRLWYYNRAVLQLRSHKLDDCRSSCQFLSTHLLRHPPRGGSRKKSTTSDASSSWSMLVVHDVDERIWWEARIAVLLAHCCRMQEDEGDEEHEQNVVSEVSEASVLDEVIQKCQALPNSRLRDQTLTYLLTHKAAVAQNGRSAVGPSIDHHDWQLLDTIADALSSSSSSSSVKPAILATKASLHLASSQENQAVTLIQQLSNSNDPDALVPDFYLSQGDYEKAASLCETRVASTSGRDNAMLLMAKSQWVRALSYTDPVKAAQVWAEISPSIQIDDNDFDDDDQPINGADLEAQELPRHHLGQQASSRRAGIPVDSSLAAPSKKKKSRAATMRRRARQREKYLKDKELPHPQPDPERWIPMYERAARRRGGGRRQYYSNISSKAAQGGNVSAQEALQLDVVARQAARASGEIDTSRSTAHMTVSGGGGGRTGGKGGKRR